MLTQCSTLLPKLSPLQWRLTAAVVFVPFMHIYGAHFASFIEMAFLSSIIVFLIGGSDVNYSRATFFNKALLFFILASASLSTFMLIPKLDTYPQILISLFRLFSVLFHLLFIFLLSKHFYRGGKLPIELLPLSVFVAAIVVWIDAIFGFPGVSSNDSYRLAISINIRFLGFVVLVSTVYLTVYFFLNFNNLSRFFYLCLIVNVTLLVWLGGRASVLAYMFSISSMLFLFKRRDMIAGNVLVNYVLLVLLSMLLSHLLTFYHWNGPSRLFLSANQYYLGEGFVEVESARMMLWEKAIEMIYEQPWLGHGADAFMLLSDTRYMQAHNDILQYSVEFGLVFTLILVGLVGYIITISLANCLHVASTENMVSFSILLAMLVQSLVDGILYHLPSLFLFCIVSAYAIGNHYKIKQSSVL